MVQELFEEGILHRNGVVKVTRSLSQLHVPPTVQGILASRIDRLPQSEKEFLQTVAVLGREFSLSLARQVTAKADEELERMLANLQVREFIYEQPAFSEIEYTFKHALTQEVAYNSVLNERRRILHNAPGLHLSICSADGSKSMSTSWHAITSAAPMLIRRCIIWPWLLAALADKAYWQRESSSQSVRLDS